MKISNVQPRIIAILQAKNDQNGFGCPMKFFISMSYNRLKMIELIARQAPRGRGSA